MPRSIKFFIAAIFAIAFIVMYLEYASPKPLNWTPTYHRTSKLPLGTKVLFDQLNKQNLPLKINDRPPIESFIKDSIGQSKGFVFINNYIPFSGTELDSLLAWVSSGQQIFISTNYAKTLFDTLGLKKTNLVLNDRVSYSPEFQLYNKKRSVDAPKVFNRSLNAYFHFSELDTLNTTVLGFMQPKDDPEHRKVNFVSVNFGKGKLLLHLAPEAFSNFFLLDADNASYTNQVLSYLNTDQKLVWDGYYKTGRESISNPLYYLLTNPSLKWAYYILIICLVLFIIFEGKRKQAAIKVVLPVTNKSYAFVQTISGMYLKKKDHRGIALKLIELFMARLRKEFHLQTHTITPQFISQLAHKLNVSQDEVNNLMLQIDKINKQSQISKNELISLEKNISKLSNYGNTK